MAKKSSKNQPTSTKSKVTEEAILANIGRARLQMDQVQAQYNQLQSLLDKLYKALEEYRALHSNNPSS